MELFGVSREGLGKFGLLRNMEGIWEVTTNRQKTQMKCVL